MPRRTAGSAAAKETASPDCRCPGSTAGDVKDAATSATIPRSQVRAGSVACRGCHQAASTISMGPNGGSTMLTPAASLTRRARRNGMAATMSVPEMRNGSGSQPPVVSTTFGRTPRRSSAAAAVSVPWSDSLTVAWGSAARSSTVKRPWRSRGLAESATNTIRSRTITSGWSSAASRGGAISRS